MQLRRDQQNKAAATKTSAYGHRLHCVGDDTYSIGDNATHAVYVLLCLSDSEGEGLHPGRRGSENSWLQGRSSKGYRALKKRMHTTASRQRTLQGEECENKKCMDLNRTAYPGSIWSLALSYLFDHECFHGTRAAGRKHHHRGYVASGC